MSRMTELCGYERDEYLELILIYPLRAIHTDEELNEAIGVVDKLLDRDDLSDGGREYLETLTQLIEIYQDSNPCIGDATNAEVLAHLLEAKGVKQADVVRATGIVASTLSDILKGKRNLTREQIGELAKYFRVSPAAFSFEKE
jgi:HTH-type transcriptional regulator/antitoxin HigA